MWPFNSKPIEYIDQAAVATLIMQDVSKEVFIRTARLPKEGDTSSYYTAEERVHAILSAHKFVRAESGTIINTSFIKAYTVEVMDESALQTVS